MLNSSAGCLFCDFEQYVPELVNCLFCKKTKSCLVGLQLDKIQ